MRAQRSQTQGEVNMSGQVILYFDDQADALRFALAAGSVMAGDEARATDDFGQKTTRVTRIPLDAPNKGKGKQPKPPESAAQRSPEKPLRNRRAKNPRTVPPRYVSGPP